MPLFHRKRAPVCAYDPNTQCPAVRRSICTGEMTLGLIDRKTGAFRDVMLARDQGDIEDFCRSIGADPNELKTIY